MSAANVQNHVRVLRAFSSWVHRDMFSDENILAKLKVPKAPRKILKTLSQEEIQQLLASLDQSTSGGCRDAAMPLLFLNTGLRSSELLHLTEQDLHFADQWLKVMGKGQKERIAPFGTQASKLLQRYFYYFRSEPMLDDQFFLCVDGWLMTENTIKLIFARQAKRAVFMIVSTLTNFPKLAPKASQVPVSIASRTAFTLAGLTRKSAAPPILSAKLIY